MDASSTQQVHSFEDDNEPLGWNFIITLYKVLSEQGPGCLELRHFTAKNECDLTLFFC